jgi:hypothetical protein
MNGGLEVNETDRLFDSEELDGFNLLAYTVLKEGEGVDPVAVGAALHQHMGWHAAEKPCSGCGTAGRYRLKQLQKVGKARRRRDGSWVRS